jgi:broad specificity phosphatase PhoE
MRPRQRVACPLPQEELTDNPKTTSFIPTAGSGEAPLSVLTLNLYSDRRPGDESGHSRGVLFDRPRSGTVVTTFILIRHAACDPVGRSIAGRRPGVHLNDVGKQQADGLADRLSGVALAGIYSSPLERALETAGPIALRQGLDVQIAAGFTEIDFGDWTGKTLAELDQLPDWRRFNSFRSGTRIPGGENMADVLGRVLHEIDLLCERHPAPGDPVAVVSHGDVLRVLLAHALGLSPDHMQRLELSPASVSILQLEYHGPRVLLLNSNEGWPGELRLRDAP